MSTKSDLTVPTALLVTGVTATSYALFANLGQVQYGVVPLVTGKLGPLRLGARDKLATFMAWFKKDQFWTVSSVSTGILANAFAAATHPCLFVQQLATAAVVTGLATLPYTLAFVFPIDKQIAQLASKADETPDAAGADAENVDALLTRWSVLHSIRFLSYAGAWVLSLAALSCADPIVIVDQIVDVVTVTPL